MNKVSGRQLWQELEIRMHSPHCAVSRQPSRSDSGLRHAGYFSSF